MPTLISEVDIRLERADLLRRIPLRRDVDPTTGMIVPPQRTPGLHLSGLLKYIAQKAKITTYLEQIAEEELPLRWAMGQAWEEFAASLYPDMLWQPGEINDPLIMNCDGIEAIEEIHDLAVIEFKFNRAKKYTGENLLKKKWLWMQQGLGYCLGYGPEFVCWRVLSAFEFPDPVFTQYLVRFSMGEIGDMKRMIEVNRDAAVAGGFAE